MQIKTTMRYQLTHVRMGIIKKKNNKYWQRRGKRGTLVTVGGNIIWCNHPGKQ